MSSYSIFDGPGGLPMVRIANAFAEAEVSFYGAQVLRYQPRDARPVLWVSEQSVYRYGKAIRGGIPVCWPWFGAHPGDPAQPAHGYARILAWPLIEAVELPDGGTRLGFALSPQALAERIALPDFDATLSVTVGRELEVVLKVANLSRVPFPYSGALHSYFAVGDIGRVRVTGLDGANYFDAPAGAECVQAGDVTFAGEVDRVYRSEAVCDIVDPAWERTIRVAKRGSASTVVWNPWIDKAARMSDFGDREYQGMLCVETANAREDARTLAPGAAGELAAIISLR